jgi:hypothetical protein
LLPALVTVFTTVFPVVVFLPATLGALIPFLAAEGLETSAFVLAISSNVNIYNQAIF